LSERCFQYCIVDEALSITSSMACQMIEAERAQEMLGEARKANEQREIDDDRSTIVDSDFEGDEDFSDNDDPVRGCAQKTPAIAESESCRVCWADLVDSEEEEINTHMGSSMGPGNDQASNVGGQPVPSRVRWEDLQDSDNEEGLVGSMAVAHHESIEDKSSSPCSGDASWPKPRPTQGHLRQQMPGNIPPRRSGAGLGGNGHMQSNKGSPKGSGRGVNHGSANRGGKFIKGSGKGASGKLQCQFLVGIEEDNQFHVVRRIIGNGGENMKSIANQSGAKLRLRGRGSKFLEGPEQQESADDLMLCVSSQDKAGIDTAKRLVSELLLNIYDTYKAFCRNVGKKAPSLGIQLHEGYRYGSR